MRHSRSMQLAPLCAASLLLLCGGCPEKRKGTSARTDLQEEVAEKVGGAPKRQLDDFNAKLGRAMAKEQANADEADAVNE